MTAPVTRRTAVTAMVSGALAASMPRPSGAAPSSAGSILSIDPTPRHELSPYLYMQFMEPLGATDGSVEAAWDHIAQQWRPDVIEATRELAPSMVRWGGIFTDYYRWREGVGPRDQRQPMLNLLWGGIESNQVGTAELVDFCRQVGAEPLVCVNFESDGRERFMRVGENIRTGDAREAAEWVAYCNQPMHPERTAHGHPQPHNVPFWQIGNETSYDRRGFDLETAAKKTVEFATAMRRSDPNIKLIGWGDGGWAPRMMEIAGEHLQYLAFHHMFNPDDPRQPVLGQLQYRKDPDRTWETLMAAAAIHEKKITEARQMVSGLDIPLAMTECHFAIPDRDRCDVLSSWAAGVAYARMLNLHQRHGDVLKIATAADFCGNRWQVNAVMIPTPASRGKSFLMPVARVMSLYRHHSGKQYVNVTAQPDGLDVVASRTGNKLFLHVVNTNRTHSVTAAPTIAGMPIKSADAYEIAVDPELEITRFRRDALDPQKKSLPADRPWQFPAASVTAIEIDCGAA